MSERKKGLVMESRNTFLLGTWRAARFRVSTFLLGVFLATPQLAHAQISDVTPPQLTLLSIQPGTVDVSASAQTVTVTFSVSDNLSGVASAGASLGLPSGFFNGGCPPLVAARVAGSALNGTYVTSLVIPRNGPAGQWPLRITLADAAGNQSILSASALSGLGQPSTVTVLSATPDSVAPQITAISFIPSVVDASNADVQVRVRVDVTDGGTGVQFNSGCSVTPGMRLVDSSFRLQQLFRGSFSLVAGTPQAGTWETSFFVRQYSTGTWSVSDLTLEDVAGNSAFYSSAALTGLGITPTVTVTSSTPDVVAPVLTSFSMSPAVINTSAGSQVVTFTLGLRDDLSGVSFAADTFFNRIWFTSPSGQQTNQIVRTDFRLVSGNVIDGVWEATMRFPQFSETGTWRPSLFRLEDRIHNVRSLTQQALQAAGFPSTLEVFQPSLTPDGSVDAGGGTVQDSTFLDRATLTFPQGVLSGPTNVAIDVLQSPLNVPLPTGFSGADTFFVNVELSPQPSYPLPAPGATLVIPLRTHVAPGTAIYLFKVDPGNGSLVPALNVAGAQVVGFASVTGLEATFPNIASFSTLVGLRSGPITLDIDFKPDDTQNLFKLGSKGAVPVVIYGTNTLDATRIDPLTLRLSGAVVKVNKAGKPQVTTEDVDGDGLPDLVAHFDSAGIRLTVESNSILLSGMTFDFRQIAGSADVRVMR
jgi:hypothetical protein